MLFLRFFIAFADQLSISAVLSSANFSQMEKL
jgi:hypothetical protein